MFIAFDCSNVQNKCIFHTCPKMPFSSKLHTAFLAPHPAPSGANSRSNTPSLTGSLVSSTPLPSPPPIHRASSHTNCNCAGHAAGTLTPSLRLTTEAVQPPTSATLSQTPHTSSEPHAHLSAMPNHVMLNIISFFFSTITGCITHRGYTDDCLPLLLALPGLYLQLKASPFFADIFAEALLDYQIRQWENCRDP